MCVSFTKANSIHKHDPPENDSQGKRSGFRNFAFAARVMHIGITLAHWHYPSSKASRAISANSMTLSQTLRLKS